MDGGVWRVRVEGWGLRVGGEGEECGESDKTDEMTDKRIALLLIICVVFRGDTPLQLSLLPFR